jgi:DNA-binding beta-propeller fold protein YncE/mono/diheme cytochrome c family protein
MGPRLLRVACLLPLLLTLAPTPARPRATEPRPLPERPVYKSPLGVAVDQTGERAYVALSTAGKVAEVELRAGKVLREVAVGKGPCDLALRDGALFVVCEGEDRLVRLDRKTLTVSGRWPTGQAPNGVAVLPESERVYVTCRDARTLQAIDLKTGQAASVALPGWPERVLPHRDAKYPYLLVLCSAPGEALISLVDSRPPLRVVQTSKLPGVSNPRGLASKQGTTSFVLVTHQKPRTRVPATQLAQGWVFTNAVSSFSPWGVDTQLGGDNRAKLLDDPLRAHADPADVVLTPDYRHAFVACAGADAVLALRTDRFVSANYGPVSFAGHDQGRDDLALTRRYVVARLATGANPRRLALSGDGRTLVVSNHLADSLTVIDATSLRVLRHVPLGGPAADAARRGEVLFHSGRLTFQGQFSCASCHPGGGSDGLNWDLPRDGVGNFLNTRALLGVRDTAPYGWHGSSPTLADRVAGTLRTLQRHEPQGTEVGDLVAYLRTLDPPRSLPRRGADAGAEARGRALFAGKARCAVCHRGHALHDEALHDVGTKVAGDRQGRFDTPSLRGLGRTAPYLHHGRARTLEEVFTRYNPQQRHGSAHLLSAQELADLVAYLKGL